MAHSGECSGATEAAQRGGRAMTDIWERVREHQQRYQRMTELEKELGVCDPEREALDDALVARVSRALGIAKSAEGQ
jgi:hypothetical protein